MATMSDQKGPPTVKEILNIARRTTDIIDNHITSNRYIFGSAACYLWADIGRVPNDIDIAVWDEDEFLEPEDIKQSIVYADDRYYLEPSRCPGATHEILYCRLPGWATDPQRRRIKVDILVPPTLHLPEFGLFEKKDTIDGLPVMPLIDLIVTKTQGWWDHRTSDREDFRAKEAADVSDIYALLDHALEEDVEDQVEAWAYRRTIEDMDYGFNLARRFVRTYGQPEKWRRIGFPL